MAPRSDEQVQAIREESRGKILDTALELFALHGFESTSVKMIAAGAGISQGLMYNYFENKRALLRAIFMRGMADVQESFARSEQGEDPGRRIERLIRGSFEIVRRHRRFWHLLHTLRMQPAVHAMLAPELGEWGVQVRSYITDCFRERNDPAPEAKAELLFAIIDGITQHYVLEPDGYPLDQVVEEAVRIYADHGARARRR